MSLTQTNHSNTSFRAHHLHCNAHTTQRYFGRVKSYLFVKL